MMKIRRRVTIVCEVECDEDFPLNELGVVWLKDDDYEADIIPVIDGASEGKFRIVDYLSQTDEEI